MFDVVTEMQSWELMGETFVPYCLRSVGLSVGIIRSDELAVYKWGIEDFVEFPGTFSPAVACRVLISLIDCVLKTKGKVQTEQDVEGFAANMIWDLSNLAVGMLMQSVEARSFSFRLLLPAVFKLLSSFSLVKVLVDGAPYTLSRHVADLLLLRQVQYGRLTLS